MKDMSNLNANGFKNEKLVRNMSVKDLHEKHVQSLSENKLLG